MRIMYCKYCNHFSQSKRIINFCRGCRKPLLPVPMKPEDFSALSVNDRYRLAYRLTNEYDELVRELDG